MQRLLAVTALASFLSNASAADKPEPILLWPAGAPGETDDKGGEKVLPDQGARKVIRLANVTAPTIAVYEPAEGKATGAAMVICPGGGYSILAMDLEGEEVAEWLTSIGVTGVLLKYRVPPRPNVPRHLAPLQDAQRAISTVRARARTWGIDPARIGIMGFSAGGHLSAAASTNFAKRAYEPIDEIDATSCRPDFTMLIYPAYLVEKGDVPKISPELPVTPDTPPTILIQTADDGIKVENSLFYYLALKNAGVPAELHLYAKGGHGYGLRPSGDPVSAWPKRCEDWLRNLGALKTEK